MVQTATPGGVPISFDAFALLLGPRRTVVAPGRPGSRQLLPPLRAGGRPRVRIVGAVAPRERVQAGHPDEVYLRLLRRDHRMERHTEDGWRGLIDRYRNLPAHPHDPRYVR